jgi:hypothetical protein
MGQPELDDRLAEEVTLARIRTSRLWGNGLLIICLLLFLGLRMAGVRLDLFGATMAVGMTAGPAVALFLIGRERRDAVDWLVGFAVFVVCFFFVTGL